MANPFSSFLRSGLENFSTSLARSSKSFDDLGPFLDAKSLARSSRNSTESPSSFCRLVDQGQCFGQPSPAIPEGWPGPSRFRRSWEIAFALFRARREPLLDRLARTVIPP